jgi:L-lactate utilization protein LutB
VSAPAGEKSVQEPMQKTRSPQKNARAECKICGAAMKKCPADVSLRQKLSTLKAQSVPQTEEIHTRAAGF